jgi:hypothetical protein
LACASQLACVLFHHRKIAASWAYSADFFAFAQILEEGKAFELGMSPNLSLRALSNAFSKSQSGFWQSVHDLEIPQRRVSSFSPCIAHS